MVSIISRIAIITAYISPIIIISIEPPLAMNLPEYPSQSSKDRLINKELSLEVFPNKFFEFDKKITYDMLEKILKISISYGKNDTYEYHIQDKNYIYIFESNQLHSMEQLDSSYLAYFWEMNSFPCINIVKSLNNLCFYSYIILDAKLTEKFLFWINRYDLEPIISSKQKEEINIKRKFYTKEILKSYNTDHKHFTNKTHEFYYLTPPLLSSPVEHRPRSTSNPKPAPKKLSLFSANTPRSEKLSKVQSKIRAGSSSSKSGESPQSSPSAQNVESPQSSPGSQNSPNMTQPSNSEPSPKRTCLSLPSSVLDSPRDHSILPTDLSSPPRERPKTCPREKKLQRKNCVSLDINPVNPEKVHSLFPNEPPASLYTYEDNKLTIHRRPSIENPPILISQPEKKVSIQTIPNIIFDPPKVTQHYIDLPQEFLTNPKPLIINFHAKDTSAQITVRFPEKQTIENSVNLTLLETLMKEIEEENRLKGPVKDPSK